MKTYTVYFDEAYRIEIEAKNRDEAQQKFMTGEYDNPEYLEITGFDIIENEKGVKNA